MVGTKIKYTCRNCGWTTSIRQEWADLRPKRCMNKKCNTSFEKHKDALVVELPEVQAPPEPKEEKPKRSKKNEQSKDTHG
jgi:hypothetical protein